MFEFDWDPAKAANNRRKHRIDFGLACEVFEDPHSRSVPDDEHGGFEERWITMGCTRDGRLLVVCHTHVLTGKGTEQVRLISARSATRNERRHYESGE